MSDSAVFARIFDVIGYIGVGALALLLIIGIVLMAMRRREHGRAAVVGISGCVVLLLGAVFNGARGFMVETVFGGLGFWMAYGVWTVLSLGLSLVGTGLMIAAVVTRRQPRQSAPGPQPYAPYPGPGPQYRPSSQYPPSPQGSAASQGPAAPEGSGPQWGQAGGHQPPQG
jgi:hypothetical protein